LLIGATTNTLDGEPLQPKQTEAAASRPCNGRPNCSGVRHQAKASAGACSRYP